MTKVNLGSILFEQKETIQTADGNGLDLIGVSNEIGLHVSRAKRISDLSRYKIIQKGWFAYNPMRVNVGSIGYVYKQDQVGIVSPDYVVFSCSERILPGYLLYLLKSDEGIEAINKNASGAVRKRLYFADLAKIEISLPSIESQRDRLNAFKKIHHLGDNISEHRLREGLLSQLKQAILQEAIQGKLTRSWRTQNPELITGKNSSAALLERIKAEKVQLVKEKKIKKEKPLPQITEDEIPFELPEGWVWCVLDEISLFKNGKAHEQFVDSDGEYILINSKFVSTNGEVIKYTGNQMMPMCTGEIAIVMSDVPNGRALSRCFLIDKDDKYSLNQRIGALTGLKGIYPPYLLMVLDRNTHYLSFNDGKKQTNLKKSQILSCPIPLPSKDEQKAIVAKVEALMEKCTSLEQQITHSEQHAQMLMQAVLKEAFEEKQKEEVEVNM